MLTACPECGTQVTAGTLCPLCGTPTPAPAPPPPAEPKGAAAAQSPPAAPRPTRHANQWDAILEKLRRVTAPRYHVRSILGVGGMAGVYLADEARLGRQVAIKVMSPGLMVDPKLVERFSQEARTIAQFTHPNIVTIYEVDEREDLHYFAMTYVAGRTLGQVMSEATVPMPIEVVRAWLYQIGDALAYAHHHNVVHRDVKPGNVLLDLRGNALVTDFGIAKVADVDAGLTRTGMLVGTPAYMSPEQCSSGKVTGASDQYSLGAVAYQMLTGQPPFLGATLSVLQAHVGGTIRPIGELRPDCPDDLRDAVQRMLAKRAEERWPTLSAAVAAAGCTPPGLDGPVRGKMEELAAPAAAVSVAPWFDVVREGARERLGVTVIGSEGEVLEGRRVSWTTEDPLIAAVSDGMLLAICPGSTSVQASCGGARTNLLLTVEADPVPGVTVEPPEVVVPTGGRFPLEAVVIDWDGSRLTDRVVLWSSSDSAVARIGSDGVVEGVRNGSAVINASTGGKSASVAVTVSADVVPPITEPSSGPGATFVPRDKSLRTPTPKSSTKTPVNADVTVPAPAGTSPVAVPRRQSERGKGRLIAVLGLVGVAVVAGVFAILQGGGGAQGTPALSIDDAGAQATQAPPDSAPGGPVAQQPDPDSLARLAAQAREDSIRDARAQAAGASSQGRSGAAPPPVNTQPVETTPRPPTTGNLEIGGNLPAGVAITLVQPDGRLRPISGRSLVLDPGTYTVQFSLDGWEIPNEVTRIVAGDTARVTARARQTPAPQPPPVTTQPTSRDVRADQSAIENAVREYVAAFNRRDADTVVPLLPAANRQAWQTLLTSRDVSSFSAVLKAMDSPAVNGDAGTVHFSIQLEFRGRNGNQNPVLDFMGNAQRAGNAWRIVSLQTAGG